MEATPSAPEALRTIVASFRAAPAALRLELLLEHARALPPLPPAYRDDPSRLERVHECQTPFFVAAEIEDGLVRLRFEAPEESPTTRGFAGILHAGLDGQTPEAVLATPDDFYDELRLAEVISPLRLRGFSAILARVKRQVRTATAS
jgi:cysteine desulfuration protein SufE